MEGFRCATNSPRVCRCARFGRQPAELTRHAFGIPARTIRAGELGQYGKADDEVGFAQTNKVAQQAKVGHARLGLLEGRLGHAVELRREEIAEVGAGEIIHALDGKISG